MKKNFWIIVCLIFNQLNFSQIQNPVIWKSEYKFINKYEILVILSATINNKWYLHFTESNLASKLSTPIKIQYDNSLKKKGKLKESGFFKKEYSDIFKSELKYYFKKIQYRQNFEIVNPSEKKIQIQVKYQVCNSRSCLAPEIKILELLIPKSPSIEVNSKKRKITSSQFDSSSIIFQSKNKELNLYRPDSLILTNRDSFNKSNNKSNFWKGFQNENPINNCGLQFAIENDVTFFKFFFLGFIGGILALLTPCVFPMIPLTISFFIKSKDLSKGKKHAIIYALMIVFIFNLLSVPFHIFKNINSNIFNQISTNVYLNLFFFIVLIIFALNFFGWFKIMLPIKLINLVDKVSNTSSWIGIFFMSLTIIIVSFSCTGPILGTLLASVFASSSGVWNLNFALLGFGFSWGLIFGFLAFFPKILYNIPKSGNWMNSLKITLGFVELALALKFLSTADLVSKTNVINREIFIGIWIILFVFLAIYLLNGIQFIHEIKIKKITSLRKYFGIFVLIFVGYLVWGILPPSKNNEIRLQALSGILPPAHLSFYKDSYNNCPMGLNCYYSIEESIKESKKTNKNILINFTGYGCENCRKMEEYVWNDPQIYKILNENLIIAYLYVDDKESLPKKEQKIIIVENGRKIKIKTIGDKWSNFQKELFNSNSQPQYILLNSKQQLLSSPLSGIQNKEKFLNFLLCGISNQSTN